MTSPPAASQISAIALINEILVARKEFAATLTSSAVGKSARIQGTLFAMSGAYTSLRISSARLEVTPTTSLFGLKVSSTAKPSRRNSGFHANSILGLISFKIAAKRSAVPTGTVDLPTTNEPGLACGATPLIEASTKDRSAAKLSFICGVPTQMKCTSQSAIAEKSVVKVNRPLFTSASKSSSKSGS